MVDGSLTLPTLKVRAVPEPLLIVEVIKSVSISWLVENVHCAEDLTRGEIGLKLLQLPEVNK